MQIKVTVKQLGKKHPYLKEQPLEIDDIGNTPLLKTLLLAVVKQQVTAFNETREGKSVLPFLTEKDIASQSDTGKIGFGAIYNNTKADVEKAQTRMLEAFNDGLFAVFQNDAQLEDLEQTISMEHNNSFTFIRLAFLAGSYY